DVDIQDKSGKTPLIIAASKGNYNITRILLNAGSDSSLRDNLGNPAVVYTDPDKNFIYSRKCHNVLCIEAGIEEFMEGTEDEINEDLRDYLIHSRGDIEDFDEPIDFEKFLALRE